MKKVAISFLFTSLAYSAAFAQPSAGCADCNANAPVEPLMVLVEGGTFEMGSKVGREGNPNANDSVHTVTLDSFYIGQVEVTRAQWLAVMVTYTAAQTNPSDPCPTCPVVNVSYSDITATNGYLARLNALTGKSYRLPTEAEWEYAARGGKFNTDSYMYSGYSVLDSVGWYNVNSSNVAHPVGEKWPNALLTYDMSGNVWEWCSDWYDANYYMTSSDHGRDTVYNPTGPVVASTRVLRGGGWNNTATSGRAASRYGSTPSYRYYLIGFRVVLSVP